MPCIVIDTNIVISAMLKPGINRELVFSPKLSFFAPDFIESEFSKYQEELLMRSGVSPQEFLLNKTNIFSLINQVPFGEYRPYRDQAFFVSPDLDDQAFFAVALCKQLPFWSNETRLKRQQIIRVFNTFEIAELLKGI